MRFETCPCEDLANEVLSSTARVQSIKEKNSLTLNQLCQVAVKISVVKMPVWWIPWRVRHPYQHWLPQFFLFGQSSRHHTFGRNRLFDNQLKLNYLLVIQQSRHLINSDSLHILIRSEPAQLTLVFNFISRTVSLFWLNICKSSLDCKFRKPDRKYLNREVINFCFWPQGVQECY